MSMVQAFRELDRVLRGGGDTGAGEGGRADRITDAGSIGRLWRMIVALAAVYGLCMGSFAAVTGRAGGWRQMLASGAKAPALLALTLAVTFPSLYVFSAISGSRLTLIALLRLLTCAITVTAALLASFGTIIAFFSFTTDSHPFMVVLNVIAFAVAGVMGLRVLFRLLQRDWGENSENMQAEALMPNEARANGVFRVWVILFALVGAQMSWVLRPFIGGQDGFALFRAKGSNFFVALWSLVVKLFE